VPAASTTCLAVFSFFLAVALTVLMKQTMQTVCAVKQSILLRCLFNQLKVNSLIKLDVYAWISFNICFFNFQFFQQKKLLKLFRFGNIWKFFCTYSKRVKGLRVRFVSAFW
jgi:hypothetical protein